MVEKNIDTTKKLYYEDSELYEFEATVLSCEPDASFFNILLDKTAFFPEGGGQYGDVGWLNNCEVYDTQETGGAIFHITEQSFNPGEKVIGRIDKNIRFDKMQQHTAEHIVSGLVNKLYGYNNVGFHLGDEVTTLDFDGKLDSLQVLQIEEQACEAVYSNLPVRTFIPSKDEEKLLDYRSKIEIEGEVRLVEIPGYDLCACCAPHVNSTGEIGLIKIVNLENYKGGTRLTMLAGKRALDDYEEKQIITKELSNLYSVPQDEITSASKKLYDELSTLKYEIIRLQEDVLNLQINDIINNAKDGLALKISDKIDMNVARRFVNNLVQRGASVAAIFVKKSEDEYQYIIGSESVNLKELSARINESLNGQGGGSDKMIRGTVKASEDSIQNSIKEIFA